MTTQGGKAWSAPSDALAKPGSSRDRASRQASGWPFRGYLALLIALIALPLLASIGYQLLLLSESRQRIAADSARSVAENAAASIRGVLDDTEETAALLAEQPQVRSRDPAHCSRLLRDLLPLLPRRANASVLDRDMRFVCSARPVPSPRIRPQHHAAFDRALRGESSLSEPVRGILSKRWIVAAAHPLRDEANRIVSVVTVTIDLARLDPFVAAGAVPAGALATVLTENGTVVARSADATRWIGRRWNAMPALDGADDDDARTYTVRDTDGVERLYGTAPINAQGWRIFVGIPTASLLAPAGEQRRLRIAWVAALLLAALAATLIARRLAGPVRAMSVALRAGGARPARLPERGPRELAELARAFNGALAAEERAMARLRESADRYEALFDQRVFGVAETDMASGRFLRVNRRFADLLGYRREELLERDVPSVTHPDDVAKNLAMVEKLRTGELSEFSIDKRYRRKDGGIAWASLSVAALRSPEAPRERELAVIHDITWRKEAEEALRANAESMRRLSAKLGTIEERERLAIHRELHDQIGANLAAAKFELAAFAAALPAGAPAALRARLRSAQQLMEETISRSRDVMAELRPPALDDYGLLAALRNLAEAYGARFGMAIRVAGEDLRPRPAPFVETAFFRIAQEALTNAAKHARAAHVSVALAAQGERVSLTVDDDGAGFDPAGARPGPSGWGLTTMRERALAIGASVRIESRPGAGTHVSVEGPREPG